MKAKWNKTEKSFRPIVYKIMFQMSATLAITAMMTAKYYHWKDDFAQNRRQFDIKTRKKISQHAAQQKNYKVFC